MRTMLKSGSGTEALRTALSQMRPEEAGLTGETDDDRVLSHFNLTVVARVPEPRSLVRPSSNGVRASCCGEHDL